MGAPDEDSEHFLTDSPLRDDGENLEGLEDNDLKTELYGKSEQMAEKDKEFEKKVKKYLRGDKANLEGLKDKKLKTRLAIREELYGKSAQVAAKAEKWLMPSEGGYLETDGIEKTWRVKQDSITKEVDISSARNQYDIVLPGFGPYTTGFTENGRYMILGGRKGHLAIVDMRYMSILREIQVKETVRDVVFLHNEQFFAAAQKKYPYIYNKDGTELHCLKEHGAVLRLQYLKDFWNIASINRHGDLRYQDVTTGQMVAAHHTKQGRSNVMELNKWNGVIGLGHAFGTVTMWKPTSTNYIVKMQCHQGYVSAMAFHPNGNIMATAGVERKIKIWDLRMFKELQTIPAQAVSLDFSQKGLLAAGVGSYIQILRDTSGNQNYSRYMSHSVAKGYQVKSASFRPYEDVLCIGHSMGWSSILVPGAGEANFDSWVANPFETNKQRREKEVKSLMDKLPPEAIMLDPKQIGNLRQPSRKEKKSKEAREEEMEAAIAEIKGKSLKHKTKGRNKPSRRLKKKMEGVDKVKRPFVEQQIKEENSRKKQKTSHEVELPKSLQRFSKNKN